MKPAKIHLCKVCGKGFQKQRSTQKICTDFACAVAIANRSAEKRAAKAAVAARKVAVAERKADREKLRSLDKGHRKRKAQEAVNRYVRLRDAALPCISCGRHHEGQWHAGHYLSRGAHPELAMEPKNIHKQCAPCNNHLSGNQINFRKGLIARYGIEYVEWLEGPHAPKKRTDSDYKAIEDEFNRLAKDIK